MFDAPEIEKHSSEAKYTDSVTKYVLIYICILLLAGLQFLIARQNISTAGMVRRMLLIAIAEAGLAIMFFMHLWAEKRGFLLFIVLITGFVLLTMQNSWTDSFRIRYGVPGGHPSPPALRRRVQRHEVQECCRAAVDWPCDFDSGIAGALPASVRAGMLPLLYPGRTIGRPDDPGAQERDPGPDCSTHVADAGDGSCVLSEER